MAPRTIPEDAVKEIVQERAEKMVDAVEESVRQHQKTHITELAANALAELEDRGVSTDRANSDVTRAAVEVAKEVLSDAPSGTQTVEVANPDRTNSGSTKMTVQTGHKPKTDTVEVVLEGGDVENPETMEVEVPDPEPIDLFAGERVVHESRMNREHQEEEEADPEDVPVAGRPRYIQ